MPIFNETQTEHALKRWVPVGREATTIPDSTSHRSYF